MRAAPASPGRPPASATLLGSAVWRLSAALRDFGAVLPCRPLRRVARVARGIISEARCPLDERPATVEAASADSALIPEEAAAFDRAWYLAAHPDVAAAGVDPFEHYRMYGKGEGRHPTPASAEEALGFDRAWYLAAYPDIAAAGVDPFEHYRTYGKGEGRHPSPASAEEALGFDRVWYLAAYPDVAAAGVDPFEHYRMYGKAEGRHPNAYFSFSPRQLAVLAKSYHYKGCEIEPSTKATDRPPPAQPAPSFDSAQYWRDRYRAGGNSGAGSYGRLASFKAEIINAFVRENDIASVIEFGCGDGAQLALADYPTYLGFDVADESIEICRSRFARDPTKEFRNSGNWDYETADLTLSLDVIFHLIEEDVFHDYMRRLFLSAERYVIVYSSNHEGEQPAAHVKHRRFTDWVEIYHANFRLVRHIPNRWPLVDDDQSQSFADFFIFEKLPTRKHTLPGHLVVSLTSYHKRFPTLELTLRRILQQSIQPDETVLWLAEKDKERLSEGVLALQRCGLTIRITKDIRSYKKIIPALEHYPDSFIITLDDDIAYPLDTIEPLVVHYRSSTEILCRRAHKITYDAIGKLLPYNQWQHETLDESGPDLFPTGCGGTLYPPRTLSSEVLQEPYLARLRPSPMTSGYSGWVAGLAPPSEG
jgi:hypothetical protein